MAAFAMTQPSSRARRSVGMPTPARGRPTVRPIDDPNEVIRPFAWIAVLFFATGFLGYFAVHPVI